MQTTSTTTTHRQVRHLDLLDNIAIASPCEASWNEMSGNDRVRFCSACKKNVYNLSAMQRAEAEALLQKYEGQVCVRLYRRKDGTVLTQDCPVAVRKKRALKLGLAAIGGGFLAAAGVLAVFAAGGEAMRRVVGELVPTSPTTAPTEHVTMGAVVAMGSAAPMPPPAPPAPPKPPVVNF